MEGNVELGEPRWLSDGARIWIEELRLFASTAARFVRHPRRFGDDWASGRARAMNPLGFLAASWPILLPIDYGLQRLLGWDARRDLPFLVEVVRALRPYVFVLPLSLLLFAVLRLAGSRRRWMTTLGVLLYWTAFSALGWSLGVAAALVFRQGDWLPFVTAWATAIWGALALAGAHRRPWALCLIALTLTWFPTMRAVSAALVWLGWT